MNRFKPVVAVQDVNNLDLFPMDHIEKLPLLYDESELREPLHRLKSKYDIALIHAHFGPSGIYGLKLKKILDIPLVTSFHGWDISALLRDNYYVRQYKDLFKEGDIFTATSKYMVQQLTDAGCPQDKIRELHVGINVSEFPFTERNQPERGRETFLTVGRLVEKKGMDDAIRAFAIVNRNYPETKLMAMGDGPLRHDLEEQVRALGLEGKITFKGACAHADVREQMQTSHIFILASKTARNGDKEGTTVVTKEALASGMPVVVTKHAGIPEVVTDGVSGFLVEEGNYQEMARKMIYLIEHPQLWRQMAWAGRRHVETEYNIVTVTNQLESLYEEAVASARKRGGIAASIVSSFRNARCAFLGERKTFLLRLKFILLSPLIVVFFLYYAIYTAYCVIFRKRLNHIKIDL
jgi:glycosyltransferase involved in cell wall biosynthesis